mmetsp:Transcript_5754/g.6396  ORF Transcript_5754/g.6396 Transcript_5754/m.6396 type:complete len:683 (+) Transcript_5754:13-2061(+)
MEDIAQTHISHVPVAGISKEVMDLLGGNLDPVSASLPPIVPTFPQTQGSKKSSVEKDYFTSAKQQQQKEFKTKVGNKWISSSKRARPWAWAPFTSSSRTDGTMFRHWVRKHVEYTDYPYAKFDVHLDPVTYSSNEYTKYLQSEMWTRSETDRLMEMARTYECRWTVMFDIFCCNDASSTRKIEDLQHRYYGVAATLSQARISREAAIEARTLSAAVAKTACANNVTSTTTTSAVNGAKTLTSSDAPITSTSPTASTDDFQTQEKTDTVLESAAARALATLAKQHQPIITHVGTGTSNKMFDLMRERERRQHLDRLWKRSKKDEAEELQLRKELKTIDAQLRKLKKNGGHILAAGTMKTTGTKITSLTSNGLPNQLPNASFSTTPSRSVTPVPQGTSAQMGADLLNNEKSNNDIVESSQVLDEYFASTAPVPMSQYPYLQSGRLVRPSGMNKSLLTRMDQVLAELKISPRPMPTKRVCDIYDSVRKDILTLVTLQKLVTQREGQLQSKRIKFSKLGGTMITPEDKVLDEERLFGIAPPPKPVSSATIGNPNSTASRGKTTKKKVTVGGGGKSKPIKKSNADSKNTGSSTTIKKKTVKRKRRTENKSPTPAANAAPGIGAAKSNSKARTTTAGATIPKSSIASKSTTPATASTSSSAGILPKVSTGSSQSSTVPSSGKKRPRKS